MTLRDTFQWSQFCPTTRVFMTLFFLLETLSLSTASTCILEIRLLSMCSEYSIFKRAMITGVIGHREFECHTAAMMVYVAPVNVSSLCSLR